MKSKLGPTARELQRLRKDVATALKVTAGAQVKTVQPLPLEPKPRPGKTAPAFKGDGWWTLEEACEYFDIPDIRRLRGWIFRNRWGDPLGNPVTGTVYPITLERYLRRNSSN